MWRSVCCAVQGVGHQKAGIPRQDMTHELVRNGVHVIVLADGAGSARLSDHGAARVTKDAAAYVADHFIGLLNCDDGREVKLKLLSMMQAGLHKEAEAHGCTVRDLASTLLLAATNEDKFLLVHIGDGVIGYLDGDELKVASHPDNGEFSNVTTFVTSREAAASMRLFKGDLKDKYAFILMSDGTEQSLYNKIEKTISIGVKKIVRSMCLYDTDQVKKLLDKAFKSIIIKNTQDDCSIALLVRTSWVVSTCIPLSFEESMVLYNIKNKRQRRGMHRRIKLFNAIIKLAKEPVSVYDIAKKLKDKKLQEKKIKSLKIIFIRKLLRRLIAIGLMKKNKYMYQLD